MATRRVPRRPRLEPLDRVAGGQGGVQDGLRLGQQRLSGLGQLDAPGVALKQDHAQVLLKGGNRGRHGALDHVEPLRGTGEATLSRDGDEVLQLAQFHELLAPIRRIKNSDGLIKSSRLS